MNRKNCCLFGTSLLLLFSILFTGCASGKETEISKKLAVTTTPAAEAIPESYDPNSRTDDLEWETRSYNSQIAENVGINVTVREPQNCTFYEIESRIFTYDTYQVTEALLGYSKDTVDSLLQKAWDAEIKDGINQAKVDFNLEADFLNLENGAKKLTNGSYGANLYYTASDLLNRYLSVRSLGSEGGFQNTGFIKRIYPDSELPFVSRGKAVAAVDNFLKSIGYKVYGDPAVYAMTADRMNRIVDKTNEYVPDGAEKNKRFQQEDSVYALYYKAGIDGYPIENCVHEGVNVSGCTSLLFYNSKHGIAGFNIGPQFIPLKKNNVTILGSDKIVELLKAKLAATPSSESIQVNEIKLAFTVTMDPSKADRKKHSALLVPCWRVGYTDTKEVTDLDGNTVAEAGELYRIFDARTGKEYELTE